MACLTVHTRAILLCLVYLLLAHSVRCQCNTDQNPYCRGNSQFEQLCCTYPSVCYWSDRSGTPACCPAGTDCSSDGGPTGGFALVQTTVQTTVQTANVVQTVYTTTQPQVATVVVYATPTTTYYSSSQWQGWQQTTTTTYVQGPGSTTFTTVATPAVVVVTATSAVAAPVTSGPVYITVQAVGKGSTIAVEGWCLARVFGALVFACGISLFI